MSQKVERCQKCILSSRFPRIEFDEQGICNYCRRAQKDDGENYIAEAKAKIEELFRDRPTGGDYDAVLCYSGGKDSTYTLQLAVEKYGLNVLAFTFDNGFLSDVALENIQRVVTTLNVDHWMFRPGGESFRNIVRAGALEEIYPAHTLTRISAVCNLCISIVNTTALKIALEKKVPYIIAGFTLGQIPLNSIMYKNNYEFLADSRRKPLARLQAAVGEDNVGRYFTLSDTLLHSVEEYPLSVNILCVEDVTESEIIAQIRQRGWIPPEDVDGCSSNCRLNTFNNHVHECTFGYNPYEMELSHLIRKRMLTREEALQKISQKSEKSLEGLYRELRLNKDDIGTMSKG